MLLYGSSPFEDYASTAFVYCPFSFEDYVSTMLLILCRLLYILLLIITIIIRVN